MRPKAILYLVLLVGSVPSLMLAQRYERLCFDPATIPRPPFRLPLKIPVGCEIIDCCPGCPGGGDILEWRIRLGGDALSAAEVRFEGLAGTDLKRLTITGNAKLQGDVILVQRGTSTIGGIPALASGRVVVGSLHRVLRSPPRAMEGDADQDVGIGDTLVIQQYVGAYVVALYDWYPTFYPCRHPGRGVAGDQLKVQNISGGDNTVVMLDSRPATGCRDDQVLRSTGINNLTNRLAASGCNSEVGVFATNNAMAFDTPVTTWTNNTGDVHTTPLQPVIVMPVTLWIANNAAAAQATLDLANANLLYAINKVGVQFNGTVNNISGNAGAVNTIGTAPCGAVGAIRGSAFYTANALNIYYVNGAFTGENCARTLPVGDGNISYMGTLANLASLAHEIGHAFGLRPAGSGGHVNTVAGFGTNNIMWGGGPPTRDAFTLGQAFRMNTQFDVWGGTMLITDGLRPGPGRPCAPLTTSTTCPSLALDWVRP